jgi:hypothetical protein
LGRRQTEEIEFATLAPHIAADDQCGSACERELLWFLQAGDDRGDLLLNAGSAQRARSAPASKRGWVVHVF